MVIVSHHRVGRHACFLRFHGNVLNSDNKHPPRLIMLLTLLFIRPRSYTSVQYGNISHTFPITPIFARRYYVQQPSADDKLPFTLSTHCRRQKRWNMYKEKVPGANMYADAPYFQESMFKSNKTFHKFLWDEPCISPKHWRNQQIISISCAHAQISVWQFYAEADDNFQPRYFYRTFITFHPSASIFSI